MNPTEGDIVITGVGLAGPLGLDKESVWAAVSQGRSGVVPLTAMESTPASLAMGGEAPALPCDETEGLPREVAYLRHAIRAALREAGGGKALPYAPSRCGLVLGTTLHGMRQAGRYLRTGDLTVLHAFLAGDTLRLATAGLVLEGWGGTVCSACSSGLASIIQAVVLLRAGELDAVVAGGYDPMSEYTYAGFNSLRLIAPGLPRPFCRDRQGMKIAEGYGLVVLERAADAARRSAAPLARLAGYGESSDAFHLTKPHSEGDGAALAMRAALERAGLAAADIGLVCAHATGTPDNDGAEAGALRQVFGQALARVPVAAFKSALGHTLGAAGSVELILSMMALRGQCVPASVAGCEQNIEFPELQLVRSQPRSEAMAHTMTNSLGFGGANTSVVLGLASEYPQATSGTASEAIPIAQSAVSFSSQNVREHQDTADSLRSLAVPLAHLDPRDVCITGIGVVMPGMVGNESFVQRINAAAPDQPGITGDTGDISDEALGPWLNARARPPHELLHQADACRRRPGLP